MRDGYAPLGQHLSFRFPVLAEEGGYDFHLPTVGEMGDEQYPGLEVDEDMDVKRWSLTGEVIEYVLLVVVILAALFGLFGSGPMSRTEARSASGTLRLEYERFQRETRPSVFRVESSVDSDKAAMHLGKALLEEWEVESVTPQPASTVVTEGDITYTFSAAGVRRLQVVFRLIPEKIGSTSVRFSDGTDAVVAKVFVYP